MTPRILAFAILALAVNLPAQVAGDFTIDPNGSGASNFKDFRTAVREVWSKGMSGPVKFTVAPGTYNEEWHVVPIKGMSSQNTLTFVSKDRHRTVFKTAGNAISIGLGTAATPIDGLVLDGFRFETSGLAIYSNTATTGVEVKNCVFASG